MLLLLWWKKVLTMSKARYKKGEQITSLDELARQKFVYVHDKITHCGWCLSWQIRVAKRYLDAGVVWKAVLKEGADHE